MPNEVKLLPCETELLETAARAIAQASDYDLSYPVCKKYARAVIDATRPTTVVTDEVVERVARAERIAVNYREMHDLPETSPLSEHVALERIAAMMGEFVDNWPQPKRFDTALKLVAKTLRAARMTGGVDIQVLVEALVERAYHEAWHEGYATGDAGGSYTAVESDWLASDARAALASMPTVVIDEVVEREALERLIAASTTIAARLDMLMPGTEIYEAIKQARTTLAKANGERPW